MRRKIRKTLILANVEATAGQAATIAAADALVISDASFETVYDNVQRNLLRPTMGHSGTLVGTRYCKIDFTVELFASGEQGVPAPWGKLLLGCGFAEVVTPGQMVEYTTVSDDLKTLTIKYSIDGLIHTVVSCMGSVTFNEPEGDRPTLVFSFMGLDGGIEQNDTPPHDLSAWKLPQVVNYMNTGNLTLGGSYAAGAVAGGTEFCSRGLTVNMSNESKYMRILGCPGFDIEDRKPSGSYSIQASPQQEIEQRKEIEDNVLTSVSLVHGTTVGKKILIFVPYAQRQNLKYDNQDGALLLSCDFNAEPKYGNDEIRIVCL